MNPLAKSRNPDQIWLCHSILLCLHCWADLQQTGRRSERGEMLPGRPGLIGYINNTCANTFTLYGHDVYPPAARNTWLLWSEIVSFSHRYWYIHSNVSGAQTPIQVPVISCAPLLWVVRSTYKCKFWCAIPALWLAACSPPIQWALFICVDNVLNITWVNTRW